MGHFPSAWEMNIQKPPTANSFVIQTRVPGFWSIAMWVCSRIGYAKISWPIKIFSVTTAILWVSSTFRQTQMWWLHGWYQNSSCTDLYSTYCPYSLIHPMIDHYQPDSMMGYVTIIESIGKTIVDLIIHWRVVTIFTIINHIWVCLKMGISRPSRNWVDLWHPEDKLCLQGMLMMNHLYKMHFKKKCIHPNAFHFLSWNDESSIKARDIYVYIYIYEYIEIEIINNIYIYIHAGNDGAVME